MVRCEKLVVNERCQQRFTTACPPSNRLQRVAFTVWALRKGNIRMKLILIFSFVSLATIFSCNSEKHKIETSHNQIGGAIDSVFNQLETDEIFNGEVLVAQEDKIIIHQYYGNSNLISNENFTDESVFEIASVSKTVYCLSNSKISIRKPIKL